MSLSRRSFLLSAAAVPLSAAKASRNYIVYFGTYTRKNSKGIYMSRFDAATGKLSDPELAAEVANPSFLAIHPNRRNVYAVSEMAAPGGGTGGALTAFTMETGGKLKRLNTVSTKGTGPCHINVDKTGKAIVVANYNSGSAAAMAVNADGSLRESTSFVQHQGKSVNAQRQSGPHAHSVNISADNRYVVVADLGLDQVLVYKFDAPKATIAPNTPPFATVKPGSGPRHFSFHPKGKYAYVINEMVATVTAFAYNAKLGTLKEIQTISTVPAGYTTPGNSTAEIRVHPNGKFLYGSNRGHNSLAVFAINGDGTLRYIKNVSTEGQIPRNFNLDPTGRWLLAANQNSDNVVAFAVDPSTGDLKPTGQQLKVDLPVCVRFVAV
ncbi:MAG: lactonase family protein [Acidobacteria bacterium]|nr:lactonase family protein [Acidobacteriota bacterium]